VLRGYRCAAACGISMIGEEFLCNQPLGTCTAVCIRAWTSLCFCAECVRPAHGTFDLHRLLVEVGCRVGCGCRSDFRRSFWCGSLLLSSLWHGARSCGGNGFGTILHVHSLDLCEQSVSWCCDIGLFAKVFDSFREQLLMVLKEMLLRRGRRKLTIQNIYT
jgi:hypothetical protein